MKTLYKALNEAMLDRDSEQLLLIIQNAKRLKAIRQGRKATTVKPKIEE